MEVKTAILVDGGFYRKRAAYLWGKKTAEDRANELYRYCMLHLRGTHPAQHLYRVFYYDCPPISKTIFNPITQKNVDFDKTDTYEWTNRFFEELKQKRKFALRLGELSDNFAGYALKPDPTKKLLTGKIQVSDITDNDLSLTVSQKGVDMKIGIDITSLAYKKQVDQIILIAGDSDFVPAAKLARREGVDFILDPLGATIKPSLFEHIDGLQSRWKGFK